MAALVLETVNPNLKKMHINSPAFAPEEQHVYRANSFNALRSARSEMCISALPHRAPTGRQGLVLPRAINMLLLRSKAA